MTPRAVPALLETIQDTVLAAARERLARASIETESIEEAREAARTGFARIPWRILGLDGERSLATDSVTVRCLQTADGDIPAGVDGVDGDDVVAVVGRSY